MMEILNVRILNSGYLINGCITVLPSDNLYQQVLSWVNDGKEVMPLFTPTELLAIDLSNKWQQVNTYESTLEVTASSGNKYAANKNARMNMIQERDSLLGKGANITEPWIEQWGIFTTNALELQEALDKALDLIRIYRNSVFGV